MNTRGAGLNIEDWHSICSQHRSYNPNCYLCNRGKWVKRWHSKLSKLTFKYCPTLWTWWANRK